MVPRTPRARRSWQLLVALGLGVGILGCSGSGGGGSSLPGVAGPGPLAIVSCSLGCNSSATGGGQFTCTINNVFQNEELRVVFNSAIDLNSATASTFQVVDEDTGLPAPGVFRLDSVDPRILVFRPVVTFNSTGTPIIGLTENARYEVKIPGLIQDGPLGTQLFLENTRGEENSIRLKCLINATRGIFDANTSAPPSTKITIEQLDTGAPGGRAVIPLGLGALPGDIYRLSPIRFVFNDIMNPALLVNPVTGTSPTIFVRVDPDGNLSDSSDQAPVAGEFSITIDSDNLTTDVEFRPTSGYPSVGTMPSPRVIIVELSGGILDLGGNPLVDAGTYTFLPELISFPAVVQTEGFFSEVTLDQARSGESSWGQGTLTPAVGGGTGRLGDLIVPAGIVPPIRLNTDFENFTDPVSGLFRPGVVFLVENLVDVPDFSTFSVMGGVFEFDRIVVEPGAVLEVEGSNPLRLYARGEFIMSGQINAVGADALIHDPNEELGGLEVAGGPSGGSGGRGGARPDGTNIDPNQVNTIVPAPADVNDPTLYGPFNGVDGEGIPIFDPLTQLEIGRVGMGTGGLGWPQPMALPAPFDMLHFPVDVLDAGYIPHDRFALCTNTAPGGSGGGGAYAFPGFPGVVASLSASPEAGPLPPVAGGGDNTGLGLNALVRTLDPEMGFLRGGGGGGGGGGHLAQSAVNGTILGDCTQSAPSTDPLQITNFVPNSSASGGGGGGAVQIQAGRLLQVAGQIFLGGGAGGDTAIDLLPSGNPRPDGRIAQPGGGGAGGAVLLQGPDVQLQLVPERIDVSPGRGGIGRSNSFGGVGAPGLVRVEASVSPPLGTAADRLSYVFDQALSILPSLTDVQASYGPGIVIEDYFTAGPWEPDGVKGATGRTGYQSCWISQRDIFDPSDPSMPLSNFFQLDFEQDGAELGWDMFLNLAGFPGVPQSYRGENDLTGPGGQTLQAMFGDDLGGAPLIVRFQGAHSAGLIRQACDVQLTGSGTEIIDGSLSPWVKHPGELSALFAVHQQPNIYRMCFIWDSSDVNYSMIESIDRIEVRFTPN